MKRLALVGLVLVMVLSTLGFAPMQDSHLGTVYVVHGVPGLTVDVYVNGDLTLPGFEPETIAGPLSLPEGDYNIVDSVFCLEERGGRTRLTQTVDIRFKGGLRLMSLLFGRSMKKRIIHQSESEFTVLKSLCEG